MIIQYAGAFHEYNYSYTSVTVSSVTCIHWELSLLGGIPEIALQHTNLDQINNYSRNNDGIHNKLYSTVWYYSISWVINSRRVWMVSCFYNLCIQLSFCVTVLLLW